MHGRCVWLLRLSSEAEFVAVDTIHGAARASVTTLALFRAVHRGMRSTSCTSSVAISYYRPIGEQLSVDEINMCRLSVCVYGGLRAMQVCSSVQ